MNEKKAVDIDKVINYLTRAFSNAQQKAIQKFGPKNNKGTPLYDYQVDFMYMLNDIRFGPRYISSMRITEANELIAELEKV